MRAKCNRSLLHHVLTNCILVQKLSDIKKPKIHKLTFCRDECPETISVCKRSELEKFDDEDFHHPELQCYKNLKYFELKNLEGSDVYEFLINC